MAQEERRWDPESLASAIRQWEEEDRKTDEAEVWEGIVEATEEQLKASVRAPKRRATAVLLEAIAGVETVADAEQYLASVFAGHWERLQHDLSEAGWEYEVPLAQAELRRLWMALVRTLRGHVRSIALAPDELGSLVAYVVRNHQRRCEDLLEQAQTRHAKEANNVLAFMRAWEARVLEPHRTAQIED